MPWFKSQTYALGQPCMRSQVATPARHSPVRQSWPAPHAVAHLPQWAGSFSKSTQLVSHAENGAAQVKTEALTSPVCAVCPVGPVLVVVRSCGDGGLARFVQLETRIARTNSRRAFFMRVQVSMLARAAIRNRS